MKTKLFGLMALVTLLGLSPAYAITYQVSFELGGSPVTGTVVTDSSFGSLAAADFSSWTFKYDGKTISGTSSAVQVTPTDPLIAYPGSLLFEAVTTGFVEFSMSSVAALLFDNNLNVFWCNLTPQGSCSSQFSSQFDEATTIAEVATTPLPAALPLFATGLGAIVLLGWRRKRANTSALAA
jgi:hypothetical protein